MFKQVVTIRILKLFISNRFIDQTRRKIKLVLLRICAIRYGIEKILFKILSTRKARRAHLFLFKKKNRKEIIKICFFLIGIGLAYVQNNTECVKMIDCLDMTTR